MTQRESRTERTLHAYVDGQLDEDEKHRLMCRMRDDDEVRARVCDLRHTKEWVQFAFEGETAPTRSLPGSSLHFGEIPLLRVAASLLVVVIAFGAGWFGHAYRALAPQDMSLAAVSEQPQHVILHIAQSDTERFSAVLAEADRILQRYSATDTRLEVIANAGGLDLLRTASSPYSENIRQMVSRYDNVRFVACSLGLRKLQQAGLDTTLIEGVRADQPAADHLIQRLSEGWTYIRI